MNVASLENSKRLFELSGWLQEDIAWEQLHIDATPELRYIPNPAVRNINFHFPAYSLDYLLDKLPKVQASTGSAYKYSLTLVYRYPIWVAGYPIKDDFTIFSFGVADNPTDAACLLAIKLIEEGIIDVKA